MYEDSRFIVDSYGNDKPLYIKITCKNTKEVSKVAIDSSAGKFILSLLSSL